MNHLILGYGYCGYYLAKCLLENNQAVNAVSRQYYPSLKLKGLHHISADITTYHPQNTSDTIIYYLIPPPSHGMKDSLLETFLQSTTIKPAKVIYFGSSSVYGCHQGKLINEQASCHLQHERQYRRLNAEKQWQDFCERQHIDCIILRIAGIYGPERLPITAAQTQSAIIKSNEAPLSNHIYLNDLVQITALLANHHQAKGIYNISDGCSRRMGSLQQQVAKELGLPLAPEQPFKLIWQKASPMKREFMQSSKCLNIQRLQDTLGKTLSLTPLSLGVRESLITQGILP